LYVNFQDRGKNISKYVEVVTAFMKEAELWVVGCLDYLVMLDKLSFLLEDKENQIIIKI
jgi:hypothetical protein